MMIMMIMLMMITTTTTINMVTVSYAYDVHDDNISIMAYHT